MHSIQITRHILFLVVLAGWGQANTAMATAGFAEWDLKTPGTNVICHSDHFIAEHGTCLRPADKTPGVIEDETVYVAHIEWWQYFTGHVVGKSQKGFFVFNESTRAVTFFDTEEAMRIQMQTLALDKPLTRRLSPQDGWQLMWAPIMRQGIERLKKSDEYKKMSEEQKRAIDRQIEQYKEPDIKPTAP